ncbi:MAG TPA: hypothetical protein VLT33_33710, partial [Labilithrix sp.]|nr:hypothetical protein [Labilithrix sp.]
MTSRSSLRALALAGLLATPLLSGCGVLGAAGRAGGSLFASPRPVKKLTDAVDKNARLSVLWVGHATALIQIDDKLILTDPVFTTT